MIAALDKIVVLMKRVSRPLRNLGEGKKTALGFTQKEIAFAVLLIDLAEVDSDYDISEHRYIVEKFKHELGLSLDQAYDLIRESKVIVAENASLDTYALLLKEKLNASDREDLMRILYEVVKADKELDSFEVALLDRYEALLDVKIDRQN